MMARHLVLMIPICVLLALLPAAWGLRLAVATLALISSTFVVAISSADIRQARLRQHGLPVPDDSQRGHPPH